MAEETSSEEKKNLLPEPENDKLILAMLLLTFFMALMILAVVCRNTPDFSDPVYSEAEPVIAPVSLKSEDDIFPININTATYSELLQIPGVGPVTADMVIDYRDYKGTILDFDEFLSVDGIGKKTVELLEQYCCIG
jgi:competence ComEA-like helix-hairpin-helix protein